MGAVASVFAAAIPAVISLFRGRPQPQNDTVNQLQQKIQEEEQRKREEENRRRRREDEEQRQRREEEDRQRRYEEEERRRRREEEERQRRRQEEEQRRQREEEEQRRRVEEERRRREEEGRRRQEQVRKDAEIAQRLAEEEKEALRQKVEETNYNLANGIQPIVLPTMEEFEAAKRRVQYNEELLHFAVSGPSGSGKSSLINAFRGLRAKDRGAAKVGVVETTSIMARYPDPRTEPPFPRFVWYDVPGAGTANIPAWQYFNKQGLFIFDFIILVYDARFTKIDADILENCRRFQIPAFIVRSKANMHIQNMRNEDDDLEYDEARAKFVEATRENLDDELKKFGLWSDETEGTTTTKQRCYIVSNDCMYDLVKNLGRKTDQYIDEPELLQDLLRTAYNRRYTKSPRSPTRSTRGSGHQNSATTTVQQGFAAATAAANAAFSRLNLPGSGPSRLS
ncbi:P-loop containing nucleoside triphosphate hydrolase protein [Wilcoxina mikolae CBS 423.85]|nr:P-loop containing nucleoside triphosphate hydrolase protein [Wilcoxina mikolae CBS 423.85]